MIKLTKAAVPTTGTPPIVYIENSHIVALEVDSIAGTKTTRVVTTKESFHVQESPEAVLALCGWLYTRQYGP